MGLVWAKGLLTISGSVNDLLTTLVLARGLRTTLVWGNESSEKRAGGNGCHTTSVSADKSWSNL